VSGSFWLNTWAAWASVPSVLVDPEPGSALQYPATRPDATDWDAMTWLVEERRPLGLRRLGFRLAARKIDLGRACDQKGQPPRAHHAVLLDMEERDVGRRR